MTNTNIPTYQEQTDLAIAVVASIGPAVTIAGRTYRISRHGADVRFRTSDRYQGENPVGATIDVLRSDLATIATQPRGYRDAALEGAALAIVRTALASIAK